MKKLILLTFLTLTAVFQYHFAMPVKFQEHMRVGTMPIKVKQD